MSKRNDTIECLNRYEEIGSGVSRGRPSYYTAGTELYCQPDGCQEDLCVDDVMNFDRTLNAVSVEEERERRKLMEMVEKQKDECNTTKARYLRGKQIVAEKNVKCLENLKKSRDIMLKIVSARFEKEIETMNQVIKRIDRDFKREMQPLTRKLSAVEEIAEKVNSLNLEDIRISMSNVSRPMAVRSCMFYGHYHYGGHQLEKDLKTFCENISAERDLTCINLLDDVWSGDTVFRLGGGHGPKPVERPSRLNATDGDHPGREALCQTDLGSRVDEIPRTFVLKREKEFYQNFSSQDRDSKKRQSGKNRQQARDRDWPCRKKRCLTEPGSKVEEVPCVPAAGYTFSEKHWAISGGARPKTLGACASAGAGPIQDHLAASGTNLRVPIQADLYPGLLSPETLTESGSLNEYVSVATNPLPENPSPAVWHLNAFDISAPPSDWNTTALAISAPSTKKMSCGVVSETSARNENLKIDLDPAPKDVVLPVDLERVNGNCSVKRTGTGNRTAMIVNNAWLGTQGSNGETM